MNYIFTHQIYKRVVEVSLAADENKMVVLKEFELSVNIESISIQTKAEHVDLWLALNKPYYKNFNFGSFCRKKSKQWTVYSP